MNEDCIVFKATWNWNGIFLLFYRVEDEEKDLEGCIARFYYFIIYLLFDISVNIEMIKNMIFYKVRREIFFQLSSLNFTQNEIILKNGDLKN